MKFLYKIAPLILLAFSALSTADIYKCNINGKVTFTDKKCKGDTLQLEYNNTFSTESYNHTYSSATWHYGYSGYTQALELSEKNNAPVFIYFHADWCGYCRKLEDELIETADGKNALKRVVKVKISPESGSNEKALFEKLGGKGFPTIFIQSRFNSAPQKHYLMEKTSGKWKTKSAVYLSHLIDSQI